MKNKPLMNFKILLVLACMVASLSLSAQRYVTPTSDFIIDANFLLRSVTPNTAGNITYEGMLPGLYVSTHKNAPFGRTYLQANYNTGDISNSGDLFENIFNVDQINVSLGYAHHIAQYYPACKIMNPFLLGLLVKADLMSMEEVTLNQEVYLNTYSLDLVIGHDLNFNSQNRLELTLFAPLITYYTTGTDILGAPQLEGIDRHIGNGESSFLFGDRTAFGGNAVYHLYFNNRVGINLRYNFETEEYSDNIKWKTLDHQISAGIVLHVD